MGTFTIPLKTVLEIEKGSIGLDTYPIFDETYRDKLNQKIIDHYWNQEIGQETIEMFRLAMSRKMNEIMPLYNQHYVLGLLTIDPLSTMSVKSITEAVQDSTTAGNNTQSTLGNSSSDSSSTAKSRTVASDTPQTQLSPDQDYASTMQDNISESTAASTANDDQTVTGTDDQTANQTGTTDNTMSGYQGHAPLLILQARQALVNVDMMVINELQDLFMLIWSNNDEYYRNDSLIGGYTRYGIY